MNKPLRVIFMGTPDFAAVALRTIIASEHEVIAAYSQPPRPKGRGHKTQKSAVHMLAEEHGIPVYTPTSLKTSEAQEEFKALGGDIAVVAAYGLLLPKAILQAPKYGCLNIHGSLLPRWRGASPIQHAIWAGDKKSGVTIMQMDEGLDTGDMIVKSEVGIDEGTTATDLHDMLASMGAAETLKVLNNIAQNKLLSAEKQDDGLAIYAPLLKKEDGLVNWDQTATEINRQVKALTPWPGVFAQIQDKRFKILQTQVASTDQALHDVPGGTVLNKDGDIVCGSGTVLKIETIQPEGKKPMAFASAINGGYIKNTKN